MKICMHEKETKQMAAIYNIPLYAILKRTYTLTLLRDKFFEAIFFSFASDFISLRFLWRVCVFIYICVCGVHQWCAPNRIAFWFLGRGSLQTMRFSMCYCALLRHRANLFGYLRDEHNFSKFARNRANSRSLSLYPISMRWQKNIFMPKTGPRFSVQFTHTHTSTKLMLHIQTSLTHRFFVCVCRVCVSSSVFLIDAFYWTKIRNFSIRLKPEMKKCLFK